MPSRGRSLIVESEEEEQLMKNFVVALVLAVVGLALPHPSHAAGVTTGIPGFYDPATGAFAPMVTKVVPLVTVARTGTVKVVITLNIEAAIGTYEPITCQASINSFDASFTNMASAAGLVVRTGATGTVTITIPYNWKMAAAGEQATVSANCSEGNGFSPGGVSHSISFTVPGFTVPTANGTITTKSLSASM
jgi:hypothetical protein